MANALIALLISFVTALIIAPIVIRIARKLKAGQVILSYVDNHKGKSGTPTMGGIIFLFAALLGALIMLRGDKLLALFSLAISLAYALNGFLDDFIKIHFKRNEGLSALQKIIFQLSIALIVGFFVYYNPLVGSTIFLPFVSKELEIGVFIIPFSVFVFLALTNSVNLTDGLDGLAGGVGLVFLAFFACILFVVCRTLERAGEDIFKIEELKNLLTLCGAMCGGLLGFLMFNSHPAKIFMGDTGSLALGGMIAALSVLTRLELVVPILGLMFMLSSVSVIIQVSYFKRTKKRVFLMAPLHHHFERKGFKETKIAAAYMIITAALGVIVTLFYILFFNFSL